MGDPPGKKIVDAQTKQEIIDAFQAKDLNSLKRIRDNYDLNEENRTLVNTAIAHLEAGYGPGNPPPGAPQPVAPGNNDDTMVSEQMKTMFRGASNGPNEVRREAIAEFKKMLLRTTYPLSDKNRDAAKWYIAELEKQIEEEDKKKSGSSAPTPEPPKPVTPGANDDKMVEEQINTIYRGASQGPNDRREAAIKALEEMINRTQYPLSAPNKSLAQTYVTNLRNQITEAINKEHYEKIRAMYDAKNKEGLISFRSTPNLSPANKNYLEACISALESGSTQDPTLPEQTTKGTPPIVPGPSGSFGGPSSGAGGAMPEIYSGNIIGGLNDRKRKFGGGVPSIDKFISEDTYQAVRGMVDNLKRYSGIDVTPELTAKIMYNYVKRQAPGSIVGKASDFIGMLPFDYSLSRGEKDTLKRAIEFLDAGRALGQDVANFDVPKLLNMVSPDILRQVDSYKDQTQKRRKGLRYKPFEMIEKSLQDYANSNADSIITKGLVAAQQFGVADFLRNAAYDKMDSIVGNRR